VDLHARESRADPSEFGEEDRPFQRQSDAMAHKTEDGPTPIGTGHFSRFKHLRKNRFKTAEEIEDHIRALRDEWSHR
jgi:hypothetical protein